MIRIRIDCDDAKNKEILDDLADEHWKWVKKYIDYDKQPDQITDDEAKKNRNESLRHLLGDVYDELEDIIKADYQKMSDITKNPKYEKFVINVDKLNDLQKKYDELEDEYEVKSGKKRINKSNGLKEAEEKLKEEVAEVSKKKKELENLIPLLGYDAFRDASGDWNAKTLCKEKLKLNVCPYCNRQYIYVTQAKGKKWVSSVQMDHFFPKEHFPLFSCSFYNLIPSCYACNHGKGENLRKTIYPYEQEFGKDAVFNICLIKEGEKIEDINLQKDIEVCITVNCSGEKATLIKNSDRVFHLTAYYNAHQADLKDILFRYQYFTGSKLDELKGLNLIKPTPANKDLHRDFILGLPLMTENMEFPLRKFKNDILEQLEEAKMNIPAKINRYSGMAETA